MTNKQCDTKGIPKIPTLVKGTSLREELVSRDILAPKVPPPPTAAWLYSNALMLHYTPT